ncbi:hypothetical protein JCM3770_006620 [Rhodotorula araucariae]
MPSTFAAAGLALAALVAVASAQPGRFPCGTTSPNARVCELLSHPTARRGLLVPVDSECVSAGSAGYFCGWAGARYVLSQPSRASKRCTTGFQMRLHLAYFGDLECTSDTQCDFGVCSATGGKLGVCLGGLGDSCDGPDGPDDSLCAGNLGCQIDAAPGKATCGGVGAECSFFGAYQASSKPNNGACLSGYCDPTSLACMAKPAPLKSAPVKPAPARAAPVANTVYYEAPADRQQPYGAAPPLSAQRQQLSVPAGATCPEGFTVCPVARRGSQGGYLFACFDTTTSASHCGGCPSIGDGLWNAGGEQGVDCSALPGVQSSACVDSTCRVFSCSAGYEFDRERNSCVAKRYW